MVGRSSKSGRPKTSPPAKTAAAVVYQDDSDDSIDQIYEVEAILKYRLRDKTPEYLIRWLGYPESENSWEPEGNVDCPKLVAAYHAAHPRSPRPSKLSPTSSASPLDASLRKLTIKPKTKKASPGGPKKAKSGGVKKAKSAK